MGPISPNTAKQLVYIVFNPTWWCILMGRIVDSYRANDNLSKFCKLSLYCNEGGIHLHRGAHIKFRPRTHFGIWFIWLSMWARVGSIPIIQDYYGDLWLWNHTRFAYFICVRYFIIVLWRHYKIDIERRVISHKLLALFVISHIWLVHFVISHILLVYFAISHKSLVLFVISHKLPVYFAISHILLVLFVISYKWLVYFLISHELLVYFVISHKLLDCFNAILNSKGQNTLYTKIKETFYDTLGVIGNIKSKNRQLQYNG